MANVVVGLVEVEVAVVGARRALLFGCRNPKKRIPCHHGILEQRCLLR